MKKILLFYVMFTCSLITILWYTLNKKKTPTTKTKPLIVCTTSILQSTVQALAGSTCTVTSLMGPGVDPHLYKPIQSDLYTLAHADLIIYNGLHLEARMADLLATLPTPPTLAATQDICKQKLLASEDNDNFYDPHIWFDIELWKQVALTISTKLQTLYPQHTKYLKKKYKLYEKNLASLEVQTKTLLNKIPKSRRILVTAHDAFAYFARFYNWQVVSLQGISTESEAGTKDIIDIASFIAHQKIPAIFVESSISPKSIYAVQEAVASHNYHVAIGGELLSDALGTKQQNANSYEKMIFYNIATITTALLQ